jgi:hypothetical protein
VEAVEEQPPRGATAIHWRLLTTLPATDAAQACEVVNLYRLRWRIEQTFRALKSDGLGLPDVQLRDAERLFKLAAIGLVAAVRTIQLVDARDGGPRPASDVADATLIAAAQVIGPTLQGKTARQQNPHPPRSLAWLAWIVGRLGGWTGYYKPPGPKTMRRGWDRLAARRLPAGAAGARTHTRYGSCVNPVARQAGSTIHCRPHVRAPMSTCGMRAEEGGSANSASLPPHFASS